MATKIEWAELTINPIQDKRKGESGRGYHCTKCQPECLHCYAETINNRFGNHQPFDDTPVEFEIVWSVIDKLKKRRKPAVVFVESMGDLFHWSIEAAQIFSILDALREIDQHRYIFLTKRAVRMRILSISYCENHNTAALPANWIGMVTAGTQATADKNIPPLLASKFQVRGVSCEPLLGELDLTPWLGIMDCGLCRTRFFGDTCPECGEVDGGGMGQIGFVENASKPYTEIDQVIVGAETGPGKRPMELDWARSLRDQCQAAGVSFFFKRGSYGNRELDGRLWEEMPG